MSDGALAPLQAALPPAILQLSRRRVLDARVAAYGEGVAKAPGIPMNEVSKTREATRNRRRGRGGPVLCTSARQSLTTPRIRWARGRGSSLKGLIGIEAGRAPRFRSSPVALGDAAGPGCVRIGAGRQDLLTIHQDQPRVLRAADDADEMADDDGVPHVHWM